jgi:hypothetical protein
MRRTPTARMRRLSSVREIVDELGGVAAVCELTKSNLKAVYHWNNSNQFPARLYDGMKRALKKRGCTAPARLWNQTQFVAKKKAA